MTTLDLAASVQQQEPTSYTVPTLNGDGSKAEHLEDGNLTTPMTSLECMKVYETEKRADAAQTADPDHTSRKDEEESPTVQDEGDYPKGVRLTFIVMALVMSIFFVGLDMVVLLSVPNVPTLDTDEDK